MPRQPNTFRLSAKNLFLTYSRCSIDKQTAMELIKSISCSSNKTFIRVSRELHEDGHPHLHVLIQFEGKLQLYNQRHFDIQQPGTDVHFHPNIQGAKSSADVKKYIEKAGDFIDWGTFKIDGRKARGAINNSDEYFAKALNTGNVQLALDTIKEHAPRDFILQFHNISNNLTKIFDIPIPAYKSKWPSSSFIVPQSIQRWVAHTFVEHSTPPAGPDALIEVVLRLNRSVDRPTSLIIEGPSRTGKTAWARSLGRHNYISGHLDFNKNTYSNDVEYNVIDDITPKYLSMKHWKELIGAQHDWQSNCKYSKPVQIKGGVPVPSIILCNPGDGTSYKDFLEKPYNNALKLWTDKNANYEFIEEPFFVLTAEETDA